MDDAKGLNILVVEDTLLVAEMIADLLIAAGAHVIGPVGRLEAAVVLARDAAIDGALLDVNLRGQYSFPVAEVLRERGVPFIFLTGYSDTSALMPEFRDAPRLVKPFREGDLMAAIAGQFRVAV